MSTPATGSLVIMASQNPGPGVTWSGPTAPGTWHGLLISEYPFTTTRPEQGAHWTDAFADPPYPACMEVMPAGPATVSQAPSQQQQPSSAFGLGTTRCITSNTRPSSVRAPQDPVTFRFFIRFLSNLRLPVPRDYLSGVNTTIPAAPVIPTPLLKSIQSTSPLSTSP